MKHEVKRGQLLGESIDSRTFPMPQTAMWAILYLEVFHIREKPKNKFTSSWIISTTKHLKASFIYPVWRHLTRNSTLTQLSIYVQIPGQREVPKENINRRYSIGQRWRTILNTAACFVFKWDIEFNPLNNNSRIWQLSEIRQFRFTHCCVTCLLLTAYSLIHAKIL